MPSARILSNTSRVSSCPELIPSPCPYALRPRRRFGDHCRYRMTRRRYLVRLELLHQVLVLTDHLLSLLHRLGPRSCSPFNRPCILDGLHRLLYVLQPDECPLVRVDGLLVQVSQRIVQIVEVFGHANVSGLPCECTSSKASRGRKNVGPWDLSLTSYTPFGGLTVVEAPVSSSTVVTVGAEMT